MLDIDDPGIALLVVAAVVVVVGTGTAVAVATFLSRRTRDARFWRESSPVSVIERRIARTLLDRLHSACAERDLPAPRITVLAVGDTDATYYFAAPAEIAPDPWQASPDGTSWSADLDVLDAEELHRPDVRVPDALVALGRTDRATVFVDLAASPGVVNVVGNRQLARKLVRRWIVELTEPSWRVDFSAGVIEDASLLTGRAMRWKRDIRSDAGRDFRGGFVAVASAVDADTVESLIDASRRDGRPGAAGVVIGPMRAPAWRIRVGAYGVLTSDVLPDVDMRDPFVPTLRGRWSRSPRVSSAGVLQGGESVDLVASSDGSANAPIEAAPADVDAEAGATPTATATGNSSETAGGGQDGEHTQDSEPSGSAKPSARAVNGPVVDVIAPVWGDAPTGGAERDLEPSRPTVESREEPADESWPTAVRPLTRRSNDDAAPALWPWTSPDPAQPTDNGIGGKP